MKRVCIILLAVWSLAGCVRRDYSKLPAVTEGHQVTMVVEISAGTALKIEYDVASRRFVPDSIRGKARQIEFLPYPVNYGFIPSTLQSKQTGGDGDPLDVMMIGSYTPTGSVVKVIPVGVLRLLDNNEKDDKILVIPADPEKRLINADDFATLSVNYPTILSLLNDWFVNYKGSGITRSGGWGDESEAWQMIMACRVKDDKTKVDAPIQ